MAVQEGLILYTIERDGCLTAVYTNEHLGSPIYNEIARKKDGKPDIIEGEYDSAYFESQNSIVSQCVLKIERKNQYRFEFKWYKQGSTTPIFQGYGYLLKHDMIAVHYGSA